MGEIQNGEKVVFYPQSEQWLAVSWLRTSWTLSGARLMGKWTPQEYLITDENQRTPDTLNTWPVRQTLQFSRSAIQDVQQVQFTKCKISLGKNPTLNYFFSFNLPNYFSILYIQNLNPNAQRVIVCS